MNSLSIAFIGAGKMATAIAAGLAKNMSEAQVRAFDISEKAAADFTKATSYACSTADAPGVIAAADVVILAVKPQYAENALTSLAGALAGKLLISIVAGWKIERLSALAKDARVIRVMPNTPALSGEGMSCFSAGCNATEQDAQIAEKILSSVGRVRSVNENLLDAVTGLSGSGPAYVMEFIMGLADGGVFCGLPRDAALELAIQTVLGTAVMCRENPAAIAALRDAVISPGGTTACGIRVLQEGAFKGLTAHAVIAGAEKSADLGKKQ